MWNENHIGSHNWTMEKRTGSSNYGNSMSPGIKMWNIFPVI